MNPFAPKYHAFTQKYPGRSLRIITPVRIAEPFDPNNVPSNPKYIDTQALWDTGATHSVITEASAKALVLVATGKRMVHHAGGEGEYNTHVVNFVLPNQVGVAGILVSECPDVGGQFGAIIGMDIISQGDLAISGHQGQTWVTFRYPSMAGIDYVADHQKLIGKTGRNEPCPCGSGKKFKKCHGSNL